MRHLKNKQTLVEIFALLLVTVLILFIFLSNEEVQHGDSYLEKEITLGDTKLDLVVHNNLNFWEDGGQFVTNTYKFYTVGSERKLLREVESQLFHSINEKYKADEEPFFSLKDITGDGIPEIFILWEQSASNLRVYKIFTWLNDDLTDVVISGGQDEIDFDSISYKDGLVYTTWHGSGGMTGTTTYHVSGRALRPVLEPSVFQNAAEALKKYVPKNDTAIDIIVETYYDLTLHYGNYSEDHNIFQLAGKLDYREFFEPYFNISWPDEKESSAEYEAFRLAFFDRNSPAWKFEFPWRTGAASGGKVVGRKLLDENMMLVYTVHGSQAYLGPAAGSCKESMDHIEKWIFKKVESEWKVAEIIENIDSWVTQSEGRTEAECKQINQDNIKKYQVN